MGILPKLFLILEAYSENRMAATPERQITRPRQSESRLALGQKMKVLGNLVSRNVNF